jgi:DNA-binding response OmpR family regulator
VTVEGQPAAWGEPRRILVIEDDAASRDLLRRVLERNGLEVVEAESAVAGLRALYEARPNLVLLDIGLPDADGRTALKRIREMTEVPIVMVTGLDAEQDKVDALRAGADDYVTKPFGLQEIVARIEALLRRNVAPEPERQAYGDGLVEIDYGSLDVRVNGTPIELTALELRLLMAFVDRPNQVLSADQLLDVVWGDSSLSRDRVKMYVGYLRNKFRDVGAEAPIETSRGFGYRYRPPSG